MIWWCWCVHVTQVRGSHYLDISSHLRMKAVNMHASVMGEFISRLHNVWNYIDASKHATGTVSVHEASSQPALRQPGRRNTIPPPPPISILPLTRANNMPNRWYLVCSCHESRNAYTVNKADYTTRDFNKWISDCSVTSLNILQYHSLLTNKIWEEIMDLTLL